MATGSRHACRSLQAPEQAEACEAEGETGGDREQCALGAKIAKARHWRVRGAGRKAGLGDLELDAVLVELLLAELLHDFVLDGRREG